jgi:hypothetical protein
VDLTLDPRRSQLLRILRTKERCSGHDIVALTLRELGITHVFGIGGVSRHAQCLRSARASWGTNAKARLESMPCCVGTRLAPGSADAAKLLQLAET